MQASPATTGILIPNRMTSLLEMKRDETPQSTIAGQVGEADLERRVAEELLQVERREEEPREHAGGHQDSDDVRRPDIADLEDPERHER